MTDYTISCKLSNETVYACYRGRFWRWDGSIWKESHLMTQKFERAKAADKKLTPQAFLTNGAEFAPLDEYELPEQMLTALREAKPCKNAPIEPVEEHPTPSAQCSDAATAAENQTAASPAAPEGSSPTTELATAADAPGVPVSADENAPVPSSTAPTFDFGADDQTNALLLQDAQTFITGNMARIMAAQHAHDLTANHYQGSWGKWCAAVGISRDTGDRMVSVAAQCGNIQLEGKSILDVQPLKLLYAAAKPSTPEVVKQAVFTGDITTYKEYQELMAQLKAEKKAGIPHRLCEGKNVALIFEKTSTRTRSSFEVAAHDLGMGSTYLDSTGSQIGKKESIADTARVLSGMFDGIEYRGYGQSIVEELAQYASVPVWNGLTDEFHPTQILADSLTIREHFGKLQGIKLVYMGDARYNMGDSLMAGCAKMGMHFVACAPEKYFPDPALIEQCQAVAAETGAVLEFISDPDKAVPGADVIYTDVWVSMGEPVEVWAERIEALSPYQVNAELMAKAKPRAVFMHCLPAYHDHKTAVGKEMGEKFNRDAMEVTDEVFNGPQSIVFQEAENRMHTIKAVMAATLGYEG